MFISDSVLRAVAHMFSSSVFHWIDTATPGERRDTAADAFQAIACEVLAGNRELQVVALRVGELMLPPVPSPHTPTHTPLGGILEGLVYQPVVASGSTVFHVLLCASEQETMGRTRTRVGGGGGAGAGRNTWAGICQCIVAGLCIPHGGHTHSLLLVAVTAVSHHG